MASDLEELDALAGRLKALSLEESTKKAYSTHRRSYLEFCNRFGLQPVPCSMQQATRYVAYLSQRLSPASIPKYLNILRILHLEAGLPDPHILEMYEPKAVLTGFEKLKGLKARQMSPITPALLLSMRELLDFSKIDDANLCSWKG